MSALYDANKMLSGHKKHGVNVSAVNTCTKRLYEYTDELQAKSDRPDDFDMILFWLEQISKHIENNA